jgi:tetratricopeptide (TPR) repeat protein
MGKEGAVFLRHRLSSWKEIASFLDRDERTVKRWESDRGLPVHRVPGAGRAAVFAYADEIEAWLRGEPGTPDASETPEASPNRRRWPRAVAGLVLLAGAALAAGVVSYAIWKQTSRSAIPLHTRDAVAVELYRSGLHEWQTRTPSGLHRAIADFRHAIARDPGFAESWVGLADAYNLEGEFSGAPQDRDYSSASTAARQAIALDPSLAGGHAAFAFAEFYGVRDVAVAQREFLRAVTLDPKSAVAHHWYATFLMTMGNFGGALSQIEAAESLDPESTAIPADKGFILFHAGRTAEAIRLLRQLEEDNPEFVSPHGYLATIAFNSNDDENFVRELRNVALTLHDKSGVAVADAAAQGLAKAGHTGMLRSLYGVRQQLFAKNGATAFDIAATCAKLGDEGCAKAYLAISVARREPQSIALLIDPPFARFHKAAWFPALLEKAGLARGLPAAPQNL